MQYWKRIIAVLLVFLLCISNGVTAMAEKATDSTVASYKYAITSRLTELESFLSDGTSGQYGLLYELQVIEEYFMYVKHISTAKNGNDSIYGFSAEEIGYYESELKSIVKNFNAQYNKDNSEFMRCTLRNKASAGTPVENAQFNLIKRIPEYLTSLLEKVQKAYNEAKKDVDKQSVLTDNATLLSNIYSCLQVYQDVPNTITNVTPEDNRGKHPVYSIDGSENNTNMNKIISELATKYKDILAYGKKVAANESEDNTLDIDTDAEYVEMFSDAVVGKKGIEIPEESHLSLPYLAMLSCSSVYTPLESYAGSEEFTEALKSLALDDDNATDLTKVYNEVKDIRKPLYKRSVDESGNPTGVARVMTIEDFFDDIQNGAAGSLCTVDGDFHYNNQALSWIYNHINVNTKLAQEVSENSQSNLETTEEDDELDSALETTEAESTEATLDNATSADSSSSGSNLSSQQKTRLADAAKMTLGDKVKVTTAVAVKLLKNQVWKSVTNTVSGVKNIMESIKSYLSSAEPRDVYAETQVGAFKDEVESWKNVVFVGDSRTVGLANACLAAVGATTASDGDTVISKANEQFKSQNVHFVAVGGKGLDQFKSDESKITDIIKDGSYTIVFNYGVNDLGNIDGYIEELNKLAAGDWASAKVIVESVGAVDETLESQHGYSVKNADVITFNDKMKKGVNASITFINVTDDMLNTDRATIDTTRYRSSDGVHYSPVTYLTLMKDVMASVKDTSSSEDSTEATSDSSASTSSDDSEDLEGGETEEDISKATYAYKEVTDESKMSESVLLYGTKSARNYDNMTTVLLQNIIKNSVAVNKIKDKNTRYLYMNPFGDIVTDDNLVILPGIANPLLTKSTSLYNPYTVAFMNYYPSVLATSINFQVTANDDIGKFVILADTKTADTKDALFNAYLITDNTNVKTSSYLEVLPLNTNFYVNTTDKISILAPQRLIFGSEEKWKDSILYDSSPIVMAKTATINEKALFPYVVEEDTGYVMAKAIAQNAFQQLTLDTQMNATKNLGYLNDNYILHNIIIYGLGGTNNPQGYAKNELSQYDNFVEGSSNRITKVITDLSNSIIDKTSNVDSVIGLKTSYEDSVLGTVFTYVRDNWLIIFVVILLILLIAFMKMHRDLLETIILMVVSTGFLYVFIYVAPVYLPMFFNVVINNTCENLTYEVLAAKTEQQDADDNNITNLDSDGNYKMNTSSLTLYRVGSANLKDFYESLGVTQAEVTGGKTAIVDQEAGTFVEGDSIKVNTDLLFKNLSITGAYTTTAEGNSVYNLSAAKTVSSNIDYYVPYYQFVDNFIDKLNTLADVYAIPRSTTVFSDGKSKNNYLVYSYKMSAPFLTPGSYGDVKTMEDNIVIDESALYQSTNEDLQKRLEAAFGTNADWLGISDTLWNLSDKSKQTLWAKTLQNNGYYDANWKPDKVKMNKLITYVNRQTKDFIFDMEDQIGEMSDSTMIKVIALRALVAFTQESSEYGNWLYPFSLNYAELSLGDVLLSVFTDDYNSFISMDSDIVSYVAEKHGWFNLVIFDLTVVLMFVLVNVVRFLVPVMYLLLGAMLLVKLVLRGDLKTTLRGYIKCSFLVFGCFTIFDLAVCLTKGISGSAFAIYILLLITLIILYCLFLVLSSILMNVTDLGNEQIGVKIRGVSESGPLKNLLNNVNINVANLTHEHNKRKKEKTVINEDLGYSRLDAYSNDAPIDSFYGSGKNMYTASRYRER